MLLTDAYRRAQRTILVAIAALVPVVFWRPMPDAFWTPKVSVLVLGAVALVAIGALARWQLRFDDVRRDPALLAMAAFALATAITSITSSDVAVSVFGRHGVFSGLVPTVACLVLAATMIIAFDDDDVRLALTGLAGGAGVVGLYAALQLANVDPFDWQDNGLWRVFGTMGNQNFLAGFLAIAAPVAAALAFWPRLVRRDRALLGAAAGLTAIGVVAAKSAQGPAALAVGLVFAAAVLLVHLRPGPATRRLVAAGAAVVVVLGIAFLAVDPGGALERGLEERGELWSAALDIFGDNPIVGAGPDTFSEQFPPHRTKDYALQYPFTLPEAAHDVPLEMLASGGILRAGTYLAAVLVTGWLLVQAVRRAATRERAVLVAAAGGGWLAYHVQSLVSIDLPALALEHWLLTGAIVVLSRPAVERVAPKAQHKRGSRHSRSQVGPTGVRLAIVVVVALVAAWQLLRPLRSELRLASVASASVAEDAVSSAEAATKAAPWHAEAWVARAQTLEAAGRGTEAVEAAVEAAERDPGSAQYALLAGKLWARYQPDQANPWFEAALDRDPYNPGVLDEAAIFYAATDPERAADLMARSLELVPDRYQAYIALGDVHRLGGDLDAAREAYERADELAPGNQASVDGLRKVDELEAAEDAGSTP